MYVNICIASVTFLYKVHKPTNNMADKYIHMRTYLSRVVAGWYYL